MPKKYDRTSEYKKMALPTSEVEPTPTSDGQLDELYIRISKLDSYADEILSTAMRVVDKLFDDPRDAGDGDISEDLFPDGSIAKLNYILDCLREKLVRLDHEVHNISKL